MNVEPTTPDTIREPTKREVRRFVRRTWLRHFGPTRNERDASRRWLRLGGHSLRMDAWIGIYKRHVDSLLNRSNVFVVESDGKPVAWACYERDDERVTLHFVFVDPAHRGNGIAKRLVERVSRGLPVTHTHRTRKEDA